MHANALWNFGILQYPEFVLKFVVFVKLGKQGTAEVISCSHEPGLASLDESYVSQTFSPDHERSFE
jgi:hypothetical protein